MENKVYIITHKKTELPSLKSYLPLAVGSLGKEFPIDFVRDDTGDNISEKNDSYCELTGLYWIWKNDKSSHAGLVHYRRYFVKVKKGLKIKGRYVFIRKKNKYHILEIKELEELLQGHDFLVKESPNIPETNAVHFKNYLGQIIWGELEQSIQNVCPEYKDMFYSVGKNTKHLNCNMFYGKKEYLNKYCDWLFKVLSEVDKIHENNYGERYHNREMGYLAEYLFQVWIEFNKLDYLLVPVVNTGDCFAMDGVLNIVEFFEFVVKKSISHIFGKIK